MKSLLKVCLAVLTTAAAVIGLSFLLEDKDNKEIKRDIED